MDVVKAWPGWCRGLLGLPQAGRACGRFSALAVTCSGCRPAAAAHAWSGVSVTSGGCRRRPALDQRHRKPSLPCGLVEQQHREGCMPQHELQPASAKAGWSSGTCMSGAASAAGVWHVGCRSGVGSRFWLQDLLQALQLLSQLSQRASSRRTAARPHHALAQHPHADCPAEPAEPC